MPEDVLDRFSDPVKKRKRKQKKEEDELKKRQKIVYGNKLFAKDLFNDEMKQEEYDKLKPFWTLSSKIDLDHELEDAQNITPSSFGIKTKKGKKQNFECISQLFNAIKCCKNWMDLCLTKMGWEKNLTDYDPIQVSNSVNELLESTIEWYKMLVKQTRLMKNFKEKFELTEE